jgi:hypothetical protein
MKTGKHIIFYALFALLAAAASAEGKPELVNERSFPVEGINLISIEYSSGRVVFLEGGDNTLSFREYMSGGKTKYYAQSSAAGGIIAIENGRRPWFRRLRARLEVYLPRSFAGDCRVSLGSGNIEAKTDIAIQGEVRVSTSSGTTRLQKLRAQKIRLRAQSGSIHAIGLYGDTDMQISSGGLHIGELEGGDHQVRLSSGSANIALASGGGSFSSSSGNITMEMARLSGDLAFELSSGNLDLTLPHNAAFYLDAETSSGGVSVKSGDDSFSVQNRASVLRPVGDNPQFTIRAEVSSGNIDIVRQ